MPTQTVETRAGVKLTRRAWASLEEAYWAVGLDPAHYLRVLQGGFRGAGAAASAGTHDQGDVVDIDWDNIPAAKRMQLLSALRRFGWCFWWRTPAYGWTSTGAHGHGVLRDSHWGLSRSAQQQVAAYDAGRNGLANNAPDPFKAYRPGQTRFGAGGYPGKAIGWTTPRSRPVRDLQRSFGLKPTGVYDQALRDHIGAYQAAHSWAYTADGRRPGVVGRWTFQGIVRTWLA